MDEAFIGSLVLFAGNFAPRNWAFCDGALLSIAQNSALFAILGTTYGGDGVQTFALPDLRGRVAIHVGAGQAGPGLSNYTLGERSGVEQVTLLTPQMPMHTHPLMGNSAAGTSPAPTGAVPAAIAGTDSNGGDITATAYATAANTPMSAQAVGVSGGSQPHENRQPYLGLNYIICMQGLFPSRN